VQCKGGLGGGDKSNLAFRFVPDINHHLFSAVVIALIRLVQFGGPVEIRPSTPWHGSLQSAAASVSDHELNLKPLAVLIGRSLRRAPVFAKLIV
jgi:hypothetical protein